MSDEYTPETTPDEGAMDPPEPAGYREEDPTQGPSGPTGSSPEAEQRAQDRSVPGTASATEGYSDDRGTGAGEPLEGLGEETGGSGRGRQDDGGFQEGGNEQDFEQSTVEGGSSDEGY
jgi:hypothetical protein